MKKITLLVVFLFYLVLVYAQTPLTEAVNFHVKTIDGETIWLFPLLDDENKIVVIDFFSTTCGSCQEYAPDFQEVYDDFGENQGNVYFLGLNWGDDNEGVREFDSIYGLTYPTVSGTQGGGNIVFNNYQIASYPTVILITPDHQIVEQYIWPPSVQNITDAIIAAGGEYVGIAKHNKWAGDIRVYPNPATEKVSVSFTLEKSLPVTYQVFNLVGRNIRSSGEEIFNRGLNKIDIPVQQLKNGTYFVRITTMGQLLLTAPFVVQ